MRRLTIAVIGVAVVTLTACSSDDPPVAAAGLPRQEVAAGEVTVTITPMRIDARGAAFALAFDTHSVDLDLNVAATAELLVGSTTWTDPAWEGDGPGGHHREGTLRFTADGPASGQATLTIDGLDEPVTARWTLPEGG